MTASLTLKTLDTFPAWLATLSDQNGPIALAGNVTSVKIAGKGTNTPSNTIGPATCTTVSENTPTATTVSGNAQLTVVSAFTGVAINSTIVGAGIPSNAVVGSFNSGAQTINMAAAGSITLANPAGTPVTATANGSGVSLIINRGQVTYTPTVTDTGAADIFQVEFAIHWTAGGVQKVPNSAAANPTIEIDTALLPSE
jgi:hypothetical protein